MKGKFMNADIWKGKTKEMRGQLKSWWGKLTDNDLQRIEGDVEHLGGSLQERYGWTKDQTKKEIEKRLSQFNKKNATYNTSTNYAKGYKGKTKSVEMTKPASDPNTQNMEDEYEQAEYEAAEGDLTERRAGFKKFSVMPNPQEWDEPRALGETEDV
jgi:uncharacterized protein YjbJ (UPF0337 family)